ncbi:hypothetical protein EC968_002120 [Mortierella alpina]|nr:hypothetical protein EC968_002120 [Mortierella alpina]
MQLHGYPATSQHTHLITEHTPRSTPIPGPLPVQSQLHNIQRHPVYSSSSSSRHSTLHRHPPDPSSSPRHRPSNPGHHSSTDDAATPTTIARQTLLDTDIGDRGAGPGETMPIPTNFSSRNNSQPEIRPRLNHYHDTTSGPVYLHSSARSHNGSASNLRYAPPSSPSSHLFHPSHPDNDLSSKHSMTTDDDNSSSASFRQRPRQLSKAGTVPSPLGGGASSYPGAKGHHSNNMSISSSAALSTFSFLSSSEKNNSVAATETNGKTPSQLRVRHLDQDSSYAGYLTKFSSRTFFSRKQWKRRYFILHQQALHCFKSSDPQHPLLETITLSADTIICVTDIFAGKRYCLQISCPGEKNWYVLADTASEMSGWLRELKGIVQRVRSLHPDQRPETLYSESSELSEMSSTSLAVRVPQVPTVPSQYEYVSGQHRPTPSGSTSSPSSYSSTHPSRHIQQSSYQNQSYQHLSPYQAQVTSLNPPPRSITPKPTTPTPGTMPQRTQDLAQGYVYGSGSPQQEPPETRRRRNSSLSAGQTAPDYASFGSVMERAEVMAAAQQNTGSSSWSVPTKSDRPGSSFSNYSTIPRSKRESTMSSMSGASTVLTNHRVSVVAELPEGNDVTLPQRNAQRLTGSFSRSMSPVSSRPMSPNLGRTSPRSSLVISPPPRSIHRPASVSIRHSTQILPPPQIMTAGLSSHPSTATSPLSANPPASGLPPTPDEKGFPGYGPLSRITSIRHQRDPGMNRQSMISVGSAKVYSQGAPTGSLQERVQRSPSKTNILRSPLVSIAVGQAAMNSVEASSASNRPLSPVPSLASAPTQPLPEPPRAGSISPHKASSAPSTQVTVTPRHQEQGLPVPTRSTARPRSQSQEDVQLSSKLGDMHLARRAMTPSPKLDATPTSASTSTPTATLTLSVASAPAETNSPLRNDSSETSGSRQKFMSLPIQDLSTLPAPPTRQTPAQPRPLNQRSSGSSSALRPISTVLSNVPSLGGGVARRSSTSNSSKPHTPSRDSMLSASARLSSLISLPPEPTTAVPPPPSGASVPHGSLPAPPTSALPMKPLDVGEASLGGTRTVAHGGGQAGFDVIPEEEEEEEYEGYEEEDDEEFGPSLHFEELEAVKDSTETDAEQDSVATTPTTPRRPEYYATKESQVVEYIFPSETFSA